MQTMYEGPIQQEKEMKIAYLYAGQGAQHAGMGKDLYEKEPAFRAAFEAGDLDFDLCRTCFEDPDHQLILTEYTQPCMTALAVGITDLLTQNGVHPDYAAGLSLGEYAALYAAGVWNASQTIQTTAFRGKAMQQAAAGMECGMTAILGLEEELLNVCCERAASETGKVVSVCNYNCPGQLVIGGEKEAVDRAGELAREAGARRCLPLAVSGPFHTALMKPAADALEKWFQDLPFMPMRIPVLFNCLGGEKEEEDSIPELLVRQVQSGVRMESILRSLLQKKVDTFVEIGPGRTLAGLVRKTAKTAGTGNLNLFSIETGEDLEQFVEWYRNWQRNGTQADDKTQRVLC